MKNPRIIQLLVILGIVLLVGYLYSKDIKGLVKPKENAEVATNTMSQQSSTANLSLSDISNTAKNMISNASSKEITQLENAYQSAGEKDKLEKAKVLAKKWEDFEQAAPSAMYWELVATKESTLNNWLNTGEMFVKAFESTQDSLYKPTMLDHANQAFKKAIEIDSTNLDAKTGLGTTIVNGMGAPMQGITMLLEVVNKEPKNVKANMVLGLFAMKSGQFDKAVSRFQTVISNSKATPDAYFYLATAYENLGKKAEAIEAYQKSKKLAANPTLSNFVDKKVAELEK